VPELPASLSVEVRSDVAVLTIDRPAKRNAIDDATLQGLGAFFGDPPRGVRAVVLHGAGDHFSAGLDLNSLSETTAEEGLHHSRMWHRAWDAIEHGAVPAISALRGAVIGGGLELAAATHLRVADGTAFYALPEGQRGIFLGGGGSVRLPRLVGTARVMDLMLTGRVLTAEEGQAVGLTQYLVEPGAALDTALELAAKVATVAPLTTFAVMHALPRIAESGPAEGYLLESLMASVASSSQEAQARMRDFLEGRAAKVAQENGS
jgi:(methylthio)acryloyl-CoA hydratase